MTLIVSLLVPRSPPRIVTSFVVSFRTLYIVPNFAGSIDRVAYASLNISENMLLIM